LFSSHTRKRSRRKTREPYVPVVRGADDVTRSVRQARSRHDDVIYPSLLVDDCARAPGCPDCACAAAAGFRVDDDCEEAGETLAPSYGQRRQRSLKSQLPCCVTDCSCTRRTSTSTQRKFTAPFPTPPPPPPASETSRGRTVDARACYGVTTPFSHDASTSFNDVYLTLHPSSAVVDDRLHCTAPHDVAPSSSNVVDQ